MFVADRGAAPGSWTQVVRQRLTDPSGTLLGRVIALDLLPMEAVPAVEFIEGDFREESVERDLEGRLGGARVDAVLSDMAPNLSGIAVADAARSLHVTELAAGFAACTLKPGGFMLGKV